MAAIEARTNHHSKEKLILPNILRLSDENEGSLVFGNERDSLIARTRNPMANATVKVTEQLHRSDFEGRESRQRLMKNIASSRMQHHHDTPDRDKTSMNSNEAALLAERQGTGSKHSMQKHKSGNGSVIAICEQLEFNNQWEGYKKNLREVHNSSSSINSSCLE